MTNEAIALAAGATATTVFMLIYVVLWAKEEIKVRKNRREINKKQNSWSWSKKDGLSGPK